MMYIQIIEGLVTSAFSGPQDKSVWEGVVEVEEDDPRYIQFITPKPARELIAPVEKLKAFLTDNPDVAELLK